MQRRTRSSRTPETKFKLVEAGANLMRARGYNATTVDDICAAAGVTKGGFFHYFKSKDELAKAALAHFHEVRVGDYEAAPFRKLADPLARVFGRLDFAGGATGGRRQPTKGCLIGVFAQEMALSSPQFREVCRTYFLRMAADFEKDLSEARAAHPPRRDFDPKGVAAMYVAIVQGSLMLAKTTGTNEVLVANLEQLRAYLQCLFGVEPSALAVPPSGTRGTSA